MITAIDDYDAMLATADRLRESGKRLDAIPLYEAASAARPDRVYPLFWLATLLAEERKYGQALRVWQARIGDRPQPDRTPFAVGQRRLLRARHARRIRVLRTRQAARSPYRKHRRPPGRPAISSWKSGRRYRGIQPRIGARSRLPPAADRATVLSQLHGDDAAGSARRRAPGLGQESRRTQSGCCRRGNARIVGRCCASATCRPTCATTRSPTSSRRCSNTAIGEVRAHRVRHVDRDGDAVTARLRATQVPWHRCSTTDDDALAQLIREQSIDVLVDLSGHTAGNRSRCSHASPRQHTQRGSAICARRG